MEWKREAAELRLTYSDLLIDYGRTDERICVVEADLMSSASTQRFKKLYPDRLINVGVAEANMISVAAGLSAMGKIPFTHTFSAFASRRCCDQVTISVAYAGLNVKMVGSDPGVGAELNGGTHMSFEDVAIMRNIPGMVIFEPVDSIQFKKLFPQILQHYGPVYIRLFRKNAWSIYDENDTFQLGKGKLLREGKDVTLAASGIMVKEALEAAECLRMEGIEAEVINIHTIKPLDEGIILASTAKTGCCVTAENASVLNGLGSAVSDCITSRKPCPVLKVGVQDRFGEVGKIDYLQKELHLTKADIVQKAKEAIALKNG
ncbi:MAG: transketolase family protein [Clostridiales bacterium]|nr:transketolase family protein [Clostridiales bacterium]MDO4349805.1 transketolase C-terminal domain-containing protein [Eubacteriales bacterium]MDY4007413.1 transketolase C-terminal domain-containing protein [Candidatus Limiplasma sp.]